LTASSRGDGITGGILKVDIVKFLFFYISLKQIECYCMGKFFGFVICLSYFEWNTHKKFS